MGTQATRGRGRSTTRGRGSVVVGRGRRQNQEMETESRSPTRPAVGRARGATNSRGGANGSGNTASGERVQRGSGFTMFAPKEEKRREVQAQAQKETDNYNKYKEGRKIKHVNYVGTAGGGPSHAPMQQTASPTKPKSLAERRAEEKIRQDDELAKKKTAARQQSERNNLKSAERNHRLDEDRRRANAAFLDKLEHQNKKKATTSPKKPSL